MTICNTWSGNQVDFNDVKEDQIDITDIAISLSRINRYCGHTFKPYSVAQHCVLVSDQIYAMTKNKQLALQGLLHEAPECYGMSDIHGSFKRSLGKHAKKVIKEFESRIFTALGLPKELDGIVDYADSMILVDEMAQLFQKKPTGIDFKDNEKYKDCKGFGIKIDPWKEETSTFMFMDRYYNLTDSYPNISEII